MIIKIKRQEKNGEPYYAEYIYNGEKHRTVSYLLKHLNAREKLVDKNSQESPRIKWECSCLQTVCGACAMVINKTPRLACETFLDKIKIKNDTLLIEPLSNFPVVEDLIVDKSIIFENYKKMQLWLNDKAKNINSNKNEILYSATKCMKCGLCLEACPNYEKGEVFFGPAMLPETMVTISQSQNADIKKEFNKHFMSTCSKSGACESVCPAKINIMTSLIGNMK